MSKFKFLVVSDPHHFSVKDVFEGYTRAFQQCGIDYEVVETHVLSNPSSILHTSIEGAYALAMAKFLNVENEFTHCLVISGILAPQWFFKSKYDKKMCLVALDDPHASKGLMDKAYESVDYWFTNEKKFTGDKIHYLPTATDGTLIPTVSKKDIPEKYQNDIVFVGTVYDDRIKPLEDVCRFAEEYGKTVKIIGPLLKTPKDSILYKYAESMIVDNRDTKLLYRGANVVINIDRDINWNAVEDGTNTQLVDVGEPYSTNPRVYEIGICRSTQLYVHPRQEVRDIFGDNIFYCDYDNVIEALKEVFDTPVERVYDMINNCFNIVKSEHTYTQRVLTMLEYLKEENK